jgi:Protein of unknown function (DUF3313)
MLILQSRFCFSVAVVLIAGLSACSKPPAAATGVKRMPAGQENSGFLSDYSKLKPNPNFENTVSFVQDDPAKNIHRYIAVIVDPPVVYVATNANPNDIPDRGRAALTEYFQAAMTRAVRDAFPVVTQPGPLVLRLRTALIGVDVGPAGEKTGESGLEHALNIGKLGVEAEFVDSETGAQIAAVVDRQSLGEGAMIGSANFTREEKYRAAVEAINGWAARLRAFLDSAHELSGEDAARADHDYKPYGAE